jgi:hypothetical protein
LCPFGQSHPYILVIGVSQRDHEKKENWKRSPDRYHRSDEVAANVELPEPLLETFLLLPAARAGTPQSGVYTPTCRSAHGTATILLAEMLAA